MGEMRRHGVIIDVNDMSGSVASDMAYLCFMVVIGAEVQRSKCHTDNGYSDS